MRIRKVIFVLLFPFMAQIALSCCRCDDPDFQGYYSNTSLSVAHINNAGAEPLVTIADSVAKAAYGIELALVRERVAKNKSIRSLFASEAYATSCYCDAEGILFPRDSISTIRIITLFPFDNNHPANTDITSYFSVFKDRAFSTINDYLIESGATLYTEAGLELRLNLLLMTPPVMGMQHRFKIQVVLSDGRMLEQETSNVNLI